MAAPVGRIDIFAAPGRPAVGIGGIVSGGHIAQVAGQVHGLVIADQRDDLAMGARRLAAAGASDPG